MLKSGSDIIIPAMITEAKAGIYFILTLHSVILTLNIFITTIKLTQNPRVFIFLSLFDFNHGRIPYTDISFNRIYGEEH